MRAQEAHELVAALPGRRRGEGRGVGPGLRQSERELLRLLLRLTRDDSGTVPWPRATKWLARETGYTASSIERARRRLVHLELLEVLHRGSGEDTGSLYRVAVEQVRAVEPVQDHLLPADTPVHPRENSLPVVAAGSEPFRPPVSTVQAPGRNGADPYTRARSSTGFTGSTKNPPNPPAASPPGGAASSTIECPRARRRGEACLDCRDCGTTRRQIRAAARAAAKAAAVAPACGVCDPVTRLEDLDDGTVRRCPVCHPNRWIGDHLAELDESFGVSKTQTRREEAG